MKKTLGLRVTAALLCALLLCPFVDTGAQAASADVWDGTVATNFAGGAGTETKPYLIKTCAQLAYLAQSNNGGENYIGKCFSLEADLNLNGIPWTPIGIDQSTRFNGTLFGNGHSIKNLYINSRSDNYIGLFGFFDGAVKELRLLDVDITGSKNVGGVCGYFYNRNNGTGISNCYVTGTVKGEESIGGIVGNYYPRGNNVVRCINYASVFSNGNNAGGIVGLCEYYSGYSGVSKTIDLCINHGTIDAYGVGVGGIVGAISSMMAIDNSINFGKIGGNSEKNGGIAGMLSGGYFYARNCANIGNVTSTGNAGGIVGYRANNSSYRTTLFNCYSAGIVSTTDTHASVGSLVGEGDRSFTNCYVLTSVANALDESESDNVTFVANMKTQAFASQLNRNINTDEYATWLWNADYYQGYPYHEPRTVQSIYVSRKPTKTAYRAGERFDPKGMVISALCNDGSSFAISSSELTYRPNTALTEGTKYVTAFYDSFSVQVSISVGANTNEYEITSLTMENASGTALSKMPKSVFYVTAAVKRLKDGSDMRVVIASYDAEGRFTGLAFVRVDMPVGATTYVSIPVDNSDGEIAEIKAFVLSSSGSLNPLSDPLSLK